MDRISRIYPYRILDSVQSLFEAISASQPQVVIPCDDGAVWQLHELHRTRPELRPLIERSLGAPSSYEIAASRTDLMQIAKDLQIRIPATREIETMTDLVSWFSAPGASGVLKLDRTTGGKGVRTAFSLAEARQAYAALRKPTTVLTAWGRWLAIKDALALWNLQHRRQPNMIVQQFIEGQPANTMFACKDGKVLALVTVEVLCAESSTGAALAVRVIENDEIRCAAELITERLQLSGFHGLDFILEQETGHAWLLELNPRCTQLGHLHVEGNEDLAGAFCRAFVGTDSAQVPAPFSEKTIAFFPQALTMNCYSSFFQAVQLDVPWEEPRLVRELMRCDWRERRLLGRMFFAIRPRGRTPVDFEAPTVSPNLASAYLEPAGIAKSNVDCL